MYTFNALIHNYVLISTICAWLLAQFLKVIVALVKEKKFCPKLLFFSLGGMPSSHTATVCALSTASVIEYGFGSFQFAVTCVIAMVVITDAMGVRWETGEQAKVINRIMKQLFAGTPDGAQTALKELVGHTPFQVMMGALIGILVPFFTMVIMK